MLLLLISCWEEKTDKPLKDNLHAQLEYLSDQEKKELVKAASEFESLKWREKDSVAMNYVYMANEYESQGKYKQALVLYKHICTMDHSLPDVFMNTALLFAKTGDLASYKKYLLKEIERAKYFIAKKHPRSDSFKISIRQAFYYLEETDSLNYYTRKFDMEASGLWVIAEPEDFKF